MTRKSLKRDLRKIERLNERINELKDALADGGSAVKQVVALGAGETYSRCLIIPHGSISPERLRTTRKSLVSYLTPAVARARRQKERNYKVHTTTTFTKTYDVIVTGVIVVDDEDEEI